MQTFRYTMPRDFNLYLFGDNHEGSLLRAADNFYEMRETILADNMAYCIEMGDCIEGICVDDKRYDVSTDAKMTPLRQCDTVVADYEPIRSKFLCVLEGNHTYTHQRIGNLVRDHICDKLRIKDKYGTYSAHITFSDNKGNTMFKVFVAHGWGSIYSIADDPIRKRANEQLMLKRKLMEKSADVVLMAMGHTHKLIVCEPTERLYLYESDCTMKQAYTKAGMNGNYIPPEHRWYVNTGSFYKLYGENGISSYAERFGLNPVELGYVVAEVRDGNITDVKKVIQ